MDVEVILTTNQTDDMRIQPTSENVREAVVQLGSEYIRIEIRSGKKYMNIIHTDNDSRVWVRFSDNDIKSGEIVDTDWNGDEYTQYHYLYIDGVRTEMIASDRTVTKDIAINVALYFVECGRLIDVPPPYFWNSQIYTEHDQSF